MRAPLQASQAEAWLFENSELLDHCTGLAFRLSGLVALYRDLTEIMAACVDEDAEPVLAERDNWVAKLDTLNNIAAEASDSFNNALRARGRPAPLNLEWQVHRSFEPLRPAPA